MTYAEFHLYYILPWIALLIFLTRNILQKNSKMIAAAIGFNMVLALVYTTPWDNYLIYKEIWTYPPERVVGRIGYIPIEEYAFFILQTLMTGLLNVLLIEKIGFSKPAHSPRRPLINKVSAVFFIFLHLLGVYFLFDSPTLYMGLILAWAAPVCALQWFVGGDLLWRNLKIFCPTVLLPTVYLWWADHTAIADGIWAISEKYTAGLNIFGLPLEEAIFFLATNLMVVQGVTLFLHPEMRERMEKFKATRQLGN